MACNCNYLLFFIWLLTMKTGEHLLHCDYSYYSLNTIVSCLVNRKIIELCITKKVKVKVTQSCLLFVTPWTGETDSWSAHTKLCTHQDPGERSSDPTRD